MAEGNKKKILIAEDEKSMAQALVLKLSHEGFDAKSVSNGADALALLSAGESFDLMLIDLMMPKMNGFDLLKEIKNKGINTPVIVLSNLSQEEDEKRAKEMGAKKFFIKSDTPISNIVEEVKKTFV